MNTELKAYRTECEGNECIITTTWVYIMGAVIKAERASGYWDRGVETSLYDEPSDDMPDAVRAWFN